MTDHTPNWRLVCEWAVEVPSTLAVRSLAEAEVVLTDERRKPGFVRAHVVDGDAAAIALSGQASAGMTGGAEA